MCVFNAAIPISLVVVVVPVGEQSINTPMRTDDYIHHKPLTMLLSK